MITVMMRGKPWGRCSKSRRSKSKREVRQDLQPTIIRWATLSRNWLKRHWLKIKSQVDQSFHQSWTTHSSRNGIYSSKLVICLRLEKKISLTNTSTGLHWKTWKKVGVSYWSAWGKWKWVDRMRAWQEFSLSSLMEFNHQFSLLTLQDWT